MYNIYLFKVFMETVLKLCRAVFSYFKMAKGLLRILSRTKTFFQQHKACYLNGI